MACDEFRNLQGDFDVSVLSFERVCSPLIDHYSVRVRLEVGWK